MNDEATGTAAWTAVLDEMDRDLAHVADQLAVTGTVVPTPAFAPPPGLPPLPASLLNRARLLLERTRRVEDELASRSQAVQSRLGGVERRQRESKPVRPAFFDRAF